MAEETEPMITVRFKGVLDPSNRTETINLSGRESIPMGGEGQITAEEYGVLTSQVGLVLEVVEKDSKKKSESANKRAANTSTDESVPAV